MKRVALLAVIVAVVGVAPAEAATLTQRVRALETKVANLQTKVNRLHAFAHNCIAYDWWPLTSYGDWESGDATFGYLYDEGDGLGPFLTTAIDYDFSGTEDFVAVAAN